MVRTQQIHASNVSSNIGEALEARIKDPLWFLAQQWQTGEFEAENGGYPANIGVSYQDFAFDYVVLGKKPQKINRSAPLEAMVEAEDKKGDALAWKAEALEYNFALGTRGHIFEATDYDGRSLDWIHFDYKGSTPVSPARGIPNEQFIRVTPSQLYFKGAPYPRWWRLEEGDAYFDSPNDPEPNILSLLLPEFFYIDVINWYTVPMPVHAGTLREVKKVQVVDSFGVVTELKPSTSSYPKDDWAIFALDAYIDPKKNKPITKPLDGHYLFVPNIAIYVLHNSDLEEVRFIRDEDANMVWAWEHRILENGRSVVTPIEMIGGPADDSNGDNLPRFVLKSPTLRNWIPYVPRRIKPKSNSEEIYLRRGRTDEAADSQNAQYRSKIVCESVHIHEEEIPISGLRIKRISRYARGSDGEPYFWVGRQKDAGQRTSRPGLRFDFIQEKNKKDSE